MMKPHYLILGKDWQLRGYRHDLNLLYNWRTIKQYYLNDMQLAAAMMCDGQSDFSAPAIPPEAHRFALRLQKDGAAEACEAGQTLNPVQRYRQVPNSYIESLLLSVTNRCNFRCRHCYMEAPQGRYGELSTQALFQLLDQLVEAGVPNIALTGGEPFIRPELPAFLRGLRDRRIGFSEIFTNASLLTDAVLDDIEDAGFRPHFKVSFDCVGNHDYMRGVPGAEEKTLCGIRLLRKRGFSVTVITSIDKVVVQGLNDTLNLLKELGVSNWWMAPPMEIGAWRGSDSNVNPNELIPALKSLLKSWYAAGRPFDMLLWRLGQYSSKGYAFQGPRTRYVDDSYNCLITHKLPFITPDGVLLPCGSFTGSAIAQTFPNLTQTPLAQAWEDPKLRSICDMRKSEVLACNPACRSCEHFVRCGSGCRVSAMLSRGNLMLSDSVCCKLHRGGYLKDFQAFAKSLDEEYR
ncbi:MAG: radical SAM protein [Bacillota bacterium]